MTGQQVALSGLNIGGSLPKNQTTNGIYLGEVREIEGAEDPRTRETRLLKAIATISEKTIAYARQIEADNETKCQIVAQNVPLSFKEYLDFVKNRAFHANNLYNSYLKYNNDDPVILSKMFDVYKGYISLQQYPIATGWVFNRYYANFKGYLNYIQDKTPNMYKNITDRAIDPQFNNETRKMHTYVSGSSGGGKTELLKALVAHDVQAGNAVVIIDPMGGFAGSVARWPEFSGEGAKRLVYLNPATFSDMVPVMNPLDAAHLGPAERSILANQLTNVLPQIGQNEWTPQTETVASACFQVLVNRPGSTLRDLRRALVEPDRKTGKLTREAEELIRLGKRHRNPEVADFFAYEFNSTQFASSKGSLRAKLAHILKDMMFSSMTCGRSTFDLAKLIDDRKVIIFDLGAWGDEDAAGAFGRMVLAQLAAIGMRRSTQYGKEHTPVFIYIDEVDFFMGRAVTLILSKLRQHGLHLTMAQQAVGYNLSADDKKQLLTNTAVKFAAGDKQEEILEMIGAPRDAARNLKVGEFVGRWGRSVPFKLSVRNDFLKEKRRMSDAELEEMMRWQASQYYAFLPDDEEPELMPEPAEYVRRRQI